MRIALAAAALAACVLLTSQLAAASGSRQLRASATMQRLGDWRIGAVASPADAIKALGAPDRCLTRNGRDGLFIWSRLGVSVAATTLGYVDDRPACRAPENFQVDHATVTGLAWRTSLGLKVGDPVARIHKLYPQAQLKHGWNAGFWLVTRRSSCIGDCGNAATVTVPVLIAKLNQGRVSAFVFHVGAQGE